MENLSVISINCCFCDINLTSDKRVESKSVTKYKCPACERLYCTADCFRGHKEKFNCSGVRNKTPYVHISKFDQKQFLDDYFFLEEVNKKVETLHRILPTLNKNKTNNNKSSQSKNQRRKWRSKARKQQDNSINQQSSNDTKQI